MYDSAWQIHDLLWWAVLILALVVLGLCAMAVLDYEKTRKENTDGTRLRRKAQR